ncbi:hypothetical protein [Mycolicibacterium neoaurum]|uniref:CsbD family protein n=1 Tax=Mycolicibacterium neoaurum TaxID=1795 RepID=A0AAV2WQ17_MYCNE|nr:hypothetical protein [Mycolicibacterium neoaurum]CDQ46036.1 hypothetical protein BN1047_03939 [Mycolicibacterium neoaurum]
MPINAGAMPPRPPDARPTLQRGEFDRIDAAENAVTADASDKRAAAQTKREDAADKRTTADRVEGLAHAEKQGRRDAAR